MDIKLEIRSAYDAFVKAHGEKPNVAYVRCWWEGVDEPESLLQTIVLDGEWVDNLCDEDKDGEYIVPFIHDDDVLYYCSDVDSLIELTEWNGYADFKVCKFIGFERLVAAECDNQSESVRYKWVAHCNDGYFEGESDKEFETETECYNDMRNHALEKMKWNTEREEDLAELEDGQYIDYVVQFFKNKIIHDSYSGIYTYEIIEVAQNKKN